MSVGERTEPAFLVTRFLEAAEEGENLYSETGRVMREACGMRVWCGLRRDAWDAHGLGREGSPLAASCGYEIALTVI